jgi:hypothetical protein
MIVDDLDHYSHMHHHHHDLNVNYLEQHIYYLEKKTVNKIINIKIHYTRTMISAPDSVDLGEGVGAAVSFI